MVQNFQSNKSKISFNLEESLKYFLLCLILCSTIISAANEKRVWIYFKDKGTVMNISISKVAKKTLSERSIQRRLNKNFSPVFDWTDLPLNNDYLEELKKMGIIIYRKSKWLNAVSFYLNGVDIQKVKSLLFVKSVSSVKVESRVTSLLFTIQILLKYFI
jgi:hypothetical protein